MLATIRNILVKGVVTKVSPDEAVRAAVELREDRLQTERISKLGPVQVMLEGMRVETDKHALPEARDDIRMH